MIAYRLQRLASVVKHLFWGGVIVYSATAMMLWDPEPYPHYQMDPVGTNHNKLMLKHLQDRLNHMETIIKMMIAGCPNDQLRRRVGLSEKGSAPMSTLPPRTVPAAEAPWDLISEPAALAAPSIPATGGDPNALSYSSGEEPSIAW